MDSESGLKAALRALALSGARQLELYPAGECVNCRFSMLYGNWVDHFDGVAYLNRLNAEKRRALAQVDAVSKVANQAPCYEPQHLTEGAAFEDLRSAAKAALKAFGWAKSAPIPKFVWGHPSCAAIVRAELGRQRAARVKARKPGGSEEDFADIRGLDPRESSVSQFRETLSRIPWLANIGKPHPRDDSVERIGRWDDWHGPEMRGCTAIGSEQSIWQNQLVDAARAEGAEINALWDQVLSECFGVFEEKSKMDLEGDPWHGPTSAAGQAGWLASTIACCLKVGRPIPKNALRQWAWYARGHWPCSYSEDDEIRFVEGIVSVESLEHARLVVY